MILLPAIDLYEGKAVRLFKGDYSQMTVYSDRPLEKAQEIEKSGATWIHLVDLEGARSGGTPNLASVLSILEHSNLKVEIGGGIRSMETIDSYIRAGVSRIILGTKAIEDPKFLQLAVERYGEKIAVGTDARNGFLATHGWEKDSGIEITQYVEGLKNIGVKTIIATDISKDGAMQGTNLSLYKSLNQISGIQVIASGGVSSLDDIQALKDIGVYGAILGKAMYIGSVTVSDAISLIGKSM